MTYNYFYWDLQSRNIHQYRSNSSLNLPRTLFIPAQESFCKRNVLDCCQIGKSKQILLQSTGAASLIIVTSAIDFLYKISGLQDRIDSSGLIHYPNLDTLSMHLIAHELRRNREIWTSWERGLLLLAVDWYSRGESCASNSSAIWTTVEDRVSVWSAFHEWAIFFDDKLNGLEASIILAENWGYTEGQIFECWQRLTKTQFRNRAIAALLQKILPLVGTLEAEFNVKTCYIKHDKLPGLQNQTNSEHVNDETWGQYQVKFIDTPLNGPAALEMWQSLVEKRKERGYII